MHPKDYSCPKDAQKEDLKGQEVSQSIEDFDTSGISGIFEIPIDCILPYLTVFVYRMLNQAHALDVGQFMINNPRQKRHIADLLDPIPCEHKEVAPF